MQVLNDTGTPLNAHYSVEAGEGCLRLTIESSGGRTAEGGDARNHEYVPAITVLLERLQARDARLLEALVVSAHLARLPEEQRRLPVGPLDLADVDDLGQLRLELTRGQGIIGLPADAKKPGNNRKRIELRLDVPAYAPTDAARLESDLATPTPHIAAPPQTKGGHGAGYGDPETNPIVEKAAMEAVEAYYTRYGWEVKDVSADCLGWDLECTDRTGTEVHHVEVKGVTGAVPDVILTVNEQAEAGEKGGWYLAVVTNAQTNPTIEFFTAGNVVDVARPTGFRADLSSQTPIDRHLR